MEIAFANEGLLYAPLFVAKQLDLLPANVGLSPVANDVEALIALEAEKAQLALCDGYAGGSWASVGRRVQRRGEHVVLDILNGSVPLWLLASTGDYESSLDEFLNKYHDTAIAAVLKSGLPNRIDSVWQLLPRGTTAYCLHRVMRGKLNSKSPRFFHEVHIQETSAVYPVASVHTSPLANLKDLDLRISADPYEVATILEGSTANLKVVHAFSGNAEYGDFAFTVGVTLDTARAKFGAEILASWAAILRARDMLNQHDPNALTALVDWYSKRPVPISLDPKLLDKAIGLLSTRAAAPHGHPIWRQIDDPVKAFGAVRKLWKEAEDQPGLQQRFLAETLATTVDRIQRSHAIDDVEEWRLAVKGPRRSELTTAVMLGLGLLVFAVYAALPFIPPDPEVFTKELLLQVPLFVVAFAGIVRSYQFIRSRKQQGRSRNWLLAECLLWFTVGSVFFGAYLDSESRRVRNDLMASPPGIQTGGPTTSTAPPELSTKAHVTVDTFSSSVSPASPQSSR